MRQAAGSRENAEDEQGGNQQDLIESSEENKLEADVNTSQMFKLKHRDSNLISAYSSGHRLNTEQDFESPNKIKIYNDDSDDESLDLNKRSHTMLNNFNSLEDLLPDEFKKQSIVMEKRPIADVYEVESYKEFNKLQYAEVLRYSSHY